MSGFLLDQYSPSATIYAHFHTFNSAGASVTITGLATTDIEIYKNGSVTQRSSDNGYALLDTDGIDFDSITGLHGISIDLSDNSDAGFYAAGAQYTVVISTITADSQTVTFILGSFTINNIGKSQLAVGYGTVGAASSTTSIVTSAMTPSGAVADQFKGRIITFTNDTATSALRGQATDITANTSAATPTFTVTALTDAPSSGDTFVVT